MSMYLTIVTILAISRTLASPSQPITGESCLAASRSTRNGRKTMGSETIGRISCLFPRGKLEPIWASFRIGGWEDAKMRLFAGDGNLHKRHATNRSIPPVTGQPSRSVSSYRSYWAFEFRQETRKVPTKPCSSSKSIGVGVVWGQYF